MAARLVHGWWAQKPNDHHKVLFPSTVSRNMGSRRPSVLEDDRCLTFFSCLFRPMRDLNHGMVMGRARDAEWGFGGGVVLGD
jgi:hypothetical protein